jgi:hypothetical protein
MAAGEISLSPLTLEGLPVEILQEIGSHLGVKDLNNLVRASRDLYAKLNVVLYRKESKRGLGGLCIACRRSHGSQTFHRFLSFFPHGNPLNIDIVSHHFKLNIYGVRCQTPLILAVRFGNTRVAHWLLQHGADIHQYEAHDSMKHKSRWQPIHWAVMCDHRVHLDTRNPRLPKNKLRNLELLLDSGANVNALTIPGSHFAAAVTPLFYEVVNNADPDIIKLLLERGADPTITCCATIKNPPNLITPLVQLIRKYDMVNGNDVVEDKRATDRGKKHFVSAMQLAKACAGRWKHSFTLNQALGECLKKVHTSSYWVSLVEELLRQGADPNVLVFSVPEGIEMPVLKVFLEAHYWWEPSFYFNPILASKHEVAQEFWLASEVTKDLVDLLLEYGVRLERDFVAKVARSQGFEDVARFLKNHIRAIETGSLVENSGITLRNKAARELYGMFKDQEDCEKSQTLPNRAGAERTSTGNTTTTGSFSRPQAGGNNQAA